jgi:hypothetical protein
VRFVLSRNVDVHEVHEVHAEIDDGMAALQHALLGNPYVCGGCFKGAFLGFLGLKEEVVFGSREEKDTADLEAVRLLLYAGAELHRRRHDGY